ncbi:MAG: hypothetical protein K0R49_1227 [Burkholderiales bacterium]|jgi:murein L,D-transpeptidase YcbB/YkuD|nr:hypothetical protein [Burkholderiales bacterium]
MKKLPLFITLVLSSVFANAKGVVTNKQVENRIKYAKNKQVLCAGDLVCKSSLLPKFYDERKYSLAWIRGNRLSAHGAQVVEAIENSTRDGLDPRAYHIKQIRKMIEGLNSHKVPANPDELANLDLTVTDGLMLYMKNLAYGWQNPKELYPTWPGNRKKINLLKAADKIVTSNSINSVLLSISPKYPDYLKLREKLADYYQIAIKNHGWETIEEDDVLQEGAKGENVALLQKRLYVSGELSDLGNPGQFDSKLEKAVTLYQRNNGIDEDGIVGPQTLRSLNVPVGDRIRQIELNMDRMRFLPESYPVRYAIVNIPDYSLKTFKNGKLQMLSPVVVGKPGKQTCVLNSQITAVEINPFWNVPKSIATRETLPAIKADPKFLSDNDIKVFKVTDGKYNEVDPSKINWKKIESAHLNFRFRQNPGDDNAMGKLKFIFPNNCGIYLHDSPFPELFDETHRGFSHGCIRVGLPTDFAQFLVSPNKNWSLQSFNTLLNSGKNKLVKLSKPLPLYIIYLTAWYNAKEDFVQFRDDIYSYDKLSLYPLYLPKIQKYEETEKLDAK